MATCDRDWLNAVRIHVCSAVSEKAVCDIFWSCASLGPRIHVTSAEDAVPAEFGIIGAAGFVLPALTITFRPLEFSVSDALVLAREAFGISKVSAILADILPIGTGWSILYGFPVGEDWRFLSLAVLGHSIVGEIIVFDEANEMKTPADIYPSSLIEEIVSLVQERCDPARPNWQTGLRDALRPILVEPFKDGQLLSAAYLNSIESRLLSVERKIKELGAMQGSEPGRAFITKGESEA